MDIELLKSEIKEARGIINKKMAYIKNAEQEIAEHLCPFSVGDRILTKDGEEREVAKISYSHYGEGYQLKVYKIKKNGEPYKDSNYVWYDEGYTKKSVI